MSTGTGFTRHSLASRQTSAPARGPGRSQTASTSAVAIVPKRAQRAGHVRAGSPDIGCAPAADRRVRQSS